MAGQPSMQVPGQPQGKSPAKKHMPWGCLIIACSFAVLAIILRILGGILSPTDLPTRLSVISLIIGILAAIGTWGQYLDPDKAAFRKMFSLWPWPSDSRIKRFGMRTAHLFQAIANWLRLFRPKARG